MSDRVCLVETPDGPCGRPVAARGWCNGHYLRWRKGGDVRADVPFRSFAQNEKIGTILFRTCTECERRLPLAEFVATRAHSKKKTTSGRCRRCRVEWVKEWRKTHPDTRKGRKLECNAARNREYLRGRKRKKRTADHFLKVKRNPRDLQWRNGAEGRVHFLPGGKRLISTRKRPPRYLTTRGEPEFGLYMNRVMVLKDRQGFLCRRDDDEDGRPILKHYEWGHLPPAYQKFVYGCQAGHTVEELGEGPGRCVACVLDKVTYLPASIRLAS